MVNSVVELKVYSSAKRPRRRVVKTLPMSQDDFDLLEGLVHDYGIRGMVDALSMMCHYQADMFRRLDEPETAKDYETDGNILADTKVKVI